MKEILNKILDTLLVILWCLLFILIYFGSIYYRKHREIDLKDNDYSFEEFTEVKNFLRKESIKAIAPALTNSEYEKRIAKQLNFTNYTLHFQDLDGLIIGLADIYERKITIDVGVSGYTFCQTFTHEALHIKYCTSNEKYICFTTFKFLYESEDSCLRSCGIRYALDNMQWGYSGEYYIQSQIIEYLKGEI